MAVLLSKDSWQSLGSTSYSANGAGTLRFNFYGKYEDVAGSVYEKNILIYTSVSSPGWYRLKGDTVNQTVAGSTKKTTFTFKSSGGYSAPSSSDIELYTNRFLVEYDHSTGKWSGTASCNIAFSYSWDGSEIQGCYTFDSSDNRDGFNGQTNTMSNTVQLPDLIPATVSVSADPSYAGTATGGGTFYVGQTATVVATPTDDFLFNFVNWTDGGSQVSTNASYSFTINGNTNLVANFELDPTLVRRHIIVN